MLTRTGTVLLSTFRVLLKQPPPIKALRSELHTPTTSQDVAGTFVLRIFNKSLLPAARSVIRSTTAANVRGLSINRTSSSYSTKSAANNLSLPTRVVLSSTRQAARSRPFGAPFQPRGPTLPCSRNTGTTVGLGTARNFSSSRPLFQNLIQNVPVAARAFCELDLDPRLAQLRNDIHKVSAQTVLETGKSSPKQFPHNSSAFMTVAEQIYYTFQIGQPNNKGSPPEPTIAHASEMEIDIALRDSKTTIHGKIQSHDFSSRTANPLQTPVRADDFDHYFNGASESDRVSSLGAPNDPFVTILAVPLAPPMYSGSREPLPCPAPSQRGIEGYLFDRELVSTQSSSFAELSSFFPSIRDDYLAHSNRVSALFALLDYVDVWNKGVSCEAYGIASNGQSAGEARVLRVEFNGWSEGRVRELLPSEDMELYEIWSEPRQIDDDMSVSFIMPTLDFSGSFGRAIEEQQDHFSMFSPDSVPYDLDSSIHSRATTPFEYDYESEFDLVENEEESEAWHTFSEHDVPSGIAFSSSFAARMAPVSGRL